MPFAQVNKANIYYELHGQGQPLVLITGYANDHYGWIPILDLLASSFQVIILDNRGVGQTTDQGLPFTIEDMAKDVIALIDTLGLKQPHLVGASMGGAIVQNVARLVGNHINKIAIINSAVKFNAAMLMAFENALEMRKAGLALDTIINTILPWLRSGAYLKNPVNIELFKKAVIGNPYPQTIVDQERQFRALQSFDSQAWLHEIVNPALVISSESDITTLPLEVKQLADAMPKACYVTIPGGHGAVAEQPKLVAALLKGFFHNEK